jgi:predicted RNase H-like nuclease (RuvC/YqgF family)
MDSKLEKVLQRLKYQYKAYEAELQEINEEEDGMIDISVACALANSIPYLIKTIDEQQKEIEFWKDLAESCECNN